MQRVTISLEDSLAARFDATVRDRAYASRSEAVRDLVRRAVDGARLTTATGACVANLSYVYNHRTRTLAARLLDLQHANHTLVVSTTHVILDHDAVFETVVLRGATAAVTAFADRIIAERGVRFGAINLVGVDANDRHSDPAAHHHHGHAHASPHPG
jgi:CopG family nickel-responsive transcriptional regulator